MKLVDTLQNLVIKGHTPLVILLNLCLTALGYALALGLRFDFVFDERFTVAYVGVPLICLCILRAWAYRRYRLNCGYWRYVTANEAVDILKAHALSSLGFAVVLAILQIEGFPRSLVLMEFALSLLLATGSRLFVRLCCEKYLTEQNVSSGETRQVVIIGGGVSGNLVVRMLHGMPGGRYRPVAIFDDAEHFNGTTLCGVPVVGPVSGLERYLEQHTQVGAVIIAIPVLSVNKLKEIEEVCRRLHLPLKHVQSFEDIACHESAEPPHALTVEQLLSREVTVEHDREIRNAIKGKRVLVTGAGGSIGSELVRQLALFGPSELILIEKCEYNLFAIQQELSANRGETKIVYSLANICDRHRLERIFADNRPQIVFHAAAYKHVPLLEANCYEAFINNIVGTRNLLEVARYNCAERFVLISTDKAVDPSSVMGCTKRIAELMVASANGLPTGRGSDALNEMSTAVVRFGNVINSAGSVIPVFKKQILAGGPITVTHPDMERYFMSIPEAVRLVLTAGVLGDRGEVFLLDMGKPLKIVDVAKKLLALYGRRDIPIIFTGLRPGEKLSETLYSLSELRTSTRFKKIFAVRSRRKARSDVFEWVAALTDQVVRLSELQVEAALRAYVKAIDYDLYGDGVPAAPIEAASEGSRETPRHLANL